MDRALRAPAAPAARHEEIQEQLKDEPQEERQILAAYTRAAWSAAR